MEREDDKCDLAALPSQFTNWHLHGTAKNGVAEQYEIDQRPNPQWRLDIACQPRLHRADKAGEIGLYRRVNARQDMGGVKRQGYLLPDFALRASSLALALLSATTR